MKISQIFKRAHSKIKSGEEVYICAAISCDSAAPRHDGNRALDVIYERINGTKRPHGLVGKSVICWLLDNTSATHDDMTRDQMRLYRMRWLNALIKEFEAKGD